MAKRTEQINLRVSEERKAEWAEFAEESQAVTGMSDLIRKGVSAYVEANGDPTALSGGSDGSDVPSDLSSRLATIEDELSNVSSTVERIDESTGFIERKIVEDEDDTSLSDRLMRVVPPAKPLSSEWEDYREQYEDHPAGEAYVWSGTVSDIADAVDADESHVEQALQSAYKYSEVPIETDVIDDIRRFWSERHPERHPYADHRSTDHEAEMRDYERRQEGR